MRRALHDRHPLLVELGAPLLIGPGSILDAHTAHERVSKRELECAVKLYVRLVRALLAQTEARATTDGRAEGVQR